MKDKNRKAMYATHISKKDLALLKSASTTEEHTKVHSMLMRKYNYDPKRAFFNLNTGKLTRNF